VCAFCGLRSYILGDVNGDTKIDYQDALITLRYSIGLEILEEAQILACDVDGNGTVNYSDALQILRKSIGLLEDFSANASTD